MRSQRSNFSTSCNPRSGLQTKIIISNLRKSYQVLRRRLWRCHLTIIIQNKSQMVWPTSTDPSHLKLFSQLISLWNLARVWLVTNEEMEREATQKTQGPCKYFSKARKVTQSTTKWCCIRSFLSEMKWCRRLTWHWGSPETCTTIWSQWPLSTISPMIAVITLWAMRTLKSCLPPIWLISHNKYISRKVKRKTHTSKICRRRSKIMSCSHIFMSKLNLHSHLIIKNRLTLSSLRIITSNMNRKIASTCITKR